MERQAKITGCTFDKSWVGPTDGETLYYHWLELDGAEKVKYCCKEKLPDKIAVGTIIRFKKNEEKNTIQLIEFKTSNPNFQQPTTSSNSYFNSKEKENKSFSKKSSNWKGSSLGNAKAQPVGAGVSGSYAKDFVVSLLNQGNKKAMADPIGVWKQYTNEIHAHLKSLEQNNDAATNESEN